MKYGFIGLGNMASAIIGGMVKNAVPAGDILGFNRTPAKTDALAAKYGIVRCESADEVVERADVIILAVKPQMLPDVMGAAAKCGGKPVLSIAAGKTLSWYMERLPEGTPVVRIMPNIAARVGESLSAICGNGFADEAVISEAKKIFACVGKVYTVEERLFPAFSSICGASGAFIYLYIDALAEAAVRAGFSRAMAEEMAAGAVLGAAKLAQESDEHPIALMNKVCSPGGTTIEGVMKLKELGFETAIQQAAQAVIDKDKLL